MTLAWAESVRDIPDALRTRPFTHEQARRAGVTPRMLMGKRFVRLFPRVWRAADYEMTADDWLAAARLSLPADAQLTGISRIQVCGLEYGPRRPLRFVVERDHHLDLEEIFLHRTKRMPPVDDVGVVVAAAFIAYCALTRVIDAIKVGDWLLHHGHMTKAAVRDLALAQLWRDGADEAIWILDHLDGDARSLPESETRAVLTFAGLPRPEVNRLLELDEDVVIIGDLLYRKWRVLVEYEGAHHQRDRVQYNSDVERYAALRNHEVRYVQATKEKLGHARTLVGEVYRQLLAAGYDGPAPEFGERWKLLFSSVAVAVGPRRARARDSARARASGA